MSVSQGQSMYLFGGKDTEGSLLNDLCTLKKSTDGSYEWVALTNVEGPTRLAKREAGELVEEESEDEDEPAVEELPALLLTLLRAQPSFDATDRTRPHRANVSW